MNRRIWWLCVLGGSLAWGQAKPGEVASKPAEEDEQKSSATTSTVAMDAPVLTLKGFCPGRNGASTAGSAPSCQTVITRAQFEKIAAAIRPNMTTAVKQQLASLYARVLVMSQAAEELALDKQAPYDQMIAFSRMQILTQGLTRKLQEDSANVSDAEIADYYQKNPEPFEEYTLERLVVPLRKQPAASKAADKEKAQSKPTPEQEAAQQAASERELTELAEKLRARAAAGEDFLKLQGQAFEAAGVQVASPTTSMNKVRRSALPATQGAIFELKVGEVSQVITDTGGHYIYKLEAKDRLPLEQVEGEIHDTLKSERVKQALDKIQNSYITETNDAYFGSPPPKRGQ
jgi:hypothetical protein